MQSLSTYSHSIARLTLAIASLTVSASVGPSLALAAPEGDPAAIGEQLLIETRFAESFKDFLTTNGMNVNELENPGDASVSKAINWRRELKQQLPSEPNEFTSMNCRSCHFVDEYLEEEDYGMRTYNDFARRSPIPDRGDGKTTTVRNAPPLVNAALDREIGFILHLDGEFTTMQDLVEGTLTGRNYGYLPAEAADAIAHIAKVLRNDDGTLLDPEILGEKGNNSTPSYRELLTGMYSQPGGAPPEEFLLPAEFLVPKAYFDTQNAENDKRLFEAGAKLIAAYTEDLAFEQISPYDVFLEQNNLPVSPTIGQSDIEYSRFLLNEIRKREQDGSLTFVTINPNTGNGKFQFHDQKFQFGPEQPFTFGPQELEGLKIFFTESKRHQKAVGNCIACHAAPHFTDFQFHNTGIAQAEYDSIHGQGAFNNLDIPALAKRHRNHDAYLPATKQHPNAQEPFRAIPHKDNVNLTDLGLWNIFGNPDFPKNQKRLANMLCANERKNKPVDFEYHPDACSPARILRQTIALFKTPGLRDLDHSAPFNHTGQINEIEDVIQGYILSSQLKNKLRNGDIELRNIHLQQSDIAPLKAFLKSLNEDYE